MVQLVRRTPPALEVWPDTWPFELEHFHNVAPDGMLVDV
jgi:hypothetical protein